MFTAITWTQYGGAICAALAAYYLYVWWRYGRKKQSGYAAGHDATAYLPGQTDFADAEGMEEEPGDEPGDAEFAQAQQLIESIKSVIQTAAMKQMDKAELTTELRNLLACYPDLRVPMFRPAINYQIITELNDTGSPTLSEREVDGLW